MVKSQQLDGEWKWENANLSAEIYFNSGSYFNKSFFKNTDIKISESFYYYLLKQDTIHFSKHSFDTDPQVIESYAIQSFSDSLLVLYDIVNKEIDEYRKINNLIYELDQYPLDQFYFGGGSLVCVSTEPKDNYDNCLNFNSISILSTIDDFEELFGKPRDATQHNGVKYYIYLIPSDLESSPYLAVNFDDQLNVNILQLTGLKSDDRFTFAGIRLGDFYTLVESKLGKPSNIKKISEDTELWSYSPFTFSIEIRNKLVYSIKLSRI